MGISEIITLVVAVSGLVTAMFAYRKNAAEAGKLEQEITDIVLTRAKLDMDKMRLRICDLEDDNKTLRKELEQEKADHQKYTKEQNEIIRALRAQLKRTESLQRKRIRELESENAELKERVEKLEKGDTGPLG